jgi:hypothetical protein
VDLFAPNELAWAVIGILNLITPDVGELATRYFNVSGVLKRRHSG